MYRFYSFFLTVSLLGWFLLGSFAQLKACVDPDTVAHITINYDSAIEEIELRVSNLRLMTEAPNKFCTCSIISFQGAFSNLKYVAFVDSGTNNPYPGFGVWRANQDASAGWDQSTNQSGWQGFVSKVIGPGLKPSQPVDMIFRATLPPGFNLGTLDSTLNFTSLGTDEFDPVTKNLAASHQGLHNGWQLPQFVNERSMSYFQAMDDQILTYYDSLATSRLPLLEGAVSLYPNPATEEVTLKLPLTLLGEVEATLYDAQGRAFNLSVLEEQVAENRLLRIHQLPVSPGLYFLHVETMEGMLTKKVILQ